MRRVSSQVLFHVCQFGPTVAPFSRSGSLAATHNLGGWGLGLALVLAACQSAGTSEAASGLRYSVLLDVAESMAAETELGIVGTDASGTFETSIEGRFGLGLLVEAPITPTVALRSGILTRTFRPVDVPGLRFEEATQWEGQLGVRFLGEARSSASWRPWAEVRGGWVPKTKVDSIFGPGTIDAALGIEGDSYAKLGIAAGVEWSLGNRWRIEAGSAYDAPLGAAEAESVVDIGIPAVTRTAIEPRGWTFWVGLSWSP